MNKPINEKTMVAASREDYKRRWETRRLRYGATGFGDKGESKKYKFKPKYGHRRKQIEPDPIELICPRCLKVFTKTKNRQVYCTKDCQVASKYPVAHRVCRCGKSFSTKRSYQMWCSVRCYKRSPEYKLAAYMRGRIHTALTRKRVFKSSRTETLLGCSFDFLRSWLECRFVKGMSWDNYGKWHVDHMLPCASFDLTDPEQQFKCFHYTNLQPMWGTDNLRKWCKTQFPLPPADTGGSVPVPVPQATAGPPGGEGHALRG